MSHKRKQARDLALEAIARNQAYFEEHQQSRNPGNDNAPGSSARNSLRSARRLAAPGEPRCSGYATALDLEGEQHMPSVGSDVSHGLQ